MTDIRAKERPLGETCDGSVSKVKKVDGRLLTPSDVLDDAFVKARVCVEFPDGENGEPVITIGQEVLDAMNGLFKNSMIVKVVGRYVSLKVLSRKLKEMWKPKGEMKVVDLPSQFFMVRFGIEEEYLAALTSGAFKAFGSYLMVRSWSPEFNPLKDEIVTTPLWVRLLNIPVNFYHTTILMGIAEGMGKPVKVDRTKLYFESFARVCVEVNLKKPLKNSVMINGKRYYVAYEDSGSICSRCWSYGHLVRSCSKGVQGTKKGTTMPSPLEVETHVEAGSQGTHEISK